MAQSTQNIAKDTSVKRTSPSRKRRRKGRRGSAFFGAFIIILILVPLYVR